MFTHKHPKFNGINDLYADKILPQLLPLEQERRKLWKSFAWQAALIGIIIPTIAGYVFFKTRHFSSVIVGGLLPIFSILGLYGSKTRGVRKSTKSILMGEVCRYLDLAFSEAFLQDESFLSDLQDLNLLPRRVHRKTYEDRISGDFEGASIVLCEAKLERKVKTNKGERWKTVFRGSILKMDFHREFIGTTIVLRDSGLFNSKRKGELKRIGLASPKFEKIFEAYGTDQVEGRYLLTPTFMETLMELEDSVDGKKIRFAFHDESLWIAVEHPNRFETKSLREPMTDSARVQTVIDELESVLSIVSAVSKPEKKRYS